MKTVKRYNSFEELKSTEAKRSEIPVILKRHSAFEKAIEEISSIKFQSRIKNQKSFSTTVNYLENL